MRERGTYSYANVRELVDQYFSLQWCRENIVVPLGVDFNANIGKQKLTIAIGNLTFLATVGDFIKHRTKAGDLECQFIELSPSTIEEILDLAAQERRFREHTPPVETSNDNQLSTQQDNGDDENYFKESDFHFDGIESNQTMEMNLINISSEPSGKIEDAVSKLLIYMHHRGGSDLVIEPYRDEYKLRARRNGLMHNASSMSFAAGAQLIGHIKTMASMDQLEQVTAQKGSIHCTHNGENMSIECSSISAKNGEIFFLKRLRKNYQNSNLDSLIIDNQLCNNLRSTINQASGVIVVTGAKGSGKSTTLAGILHEIDTEERLTLTAEDPIDYDFGGHIQQVPLNRAEGQTYAEFLSLLAEQDPDILLIGEAIDPETAESCMDAAEKGHLVFTTMYANSSSSALGRLIDMKVPIYKIKASLRGVLAQQLFGKVCPACSIERPMTELEAQLTTLPNGTTVRVAKILNREEQQQGQDNGSLCKLCHGRGYLGCIAAYEFLEMNPSIKDAINAKTSSEDIQKAAINSGMTTLKQYAIELVRQKLTTVDEVKRVCGHFAEN